MLAAGRLLVGRSVHGMAEAVAAADAGADYLTFGHVFPTTSHPGLPPRGLEELAAIVEAVEVPVLAIGGITVDNLDARPGDRLRRHRRHLGHPRRRRSQSRRGAPAGRARRVHLTNPATHFRLPGPHRRNRMQLIVNQQPFEFASEAARRARAAGQQRRCSQRPSRWPSTAKSCRAGAGRR